MRRSGMVALMALWMIGVCFGQTAIAGGETPHVEKIAPRTTGSFYLKDGDRVVFYGDSITDQRLYTTYIETYCLSRFPNRHFTFVHSGWGGDRVTGGGGGPIDLRLHRDVLAYKPTVVTICLGMNDGSYKPYDDATFQTYARGYEHILDTLRKELPTARITLLTAPAFDDVTRAPGFPGGYNATLVALGEYVKELGRRYHLTVADTNAPLISTLAIARSHDAALAAKIIPDRVHPGPGGHIVMAAAVLKAWNAPETVTEFEINASGQTLQVANADVSDFHASDARVSFRHTDHALPWPLDRDPAKNPDTTLVLASTDIESTLNRDILKVNGLSAPNYILKADGTQVATFTRTDLENGIDLATLPNLPANVQAQEVLALVRRHNDLHFKRWRVVQVPGGKDIKVTPEMQKQMDDLDKQEEQVIAQLRNAVKPKTHTLELVAAP